jgi:hypothetical protein
MSVSRQRTYACLLALGASILLYRALSLAFLEGGIDTLIVPVVALTFIEMAVDLACLGFAIRWAMQAASTYALVPLRLGAVATFIHLVRVVIFALGRSWFAYNFDIRPEYRETTTTEVFWVYFALALSVLGVVAVGVIYALLRRQRRMAALLGQRYALPGRETPQPGRVVGAAAEPTQTMAGPVDTSPGLRLDVPGSTLDEAPQPEGERKQARPRRPGPGVRSRG